MKSIFLLPIIALYICEGCGIKASANDEAAKVDSLEGRLNDLQKKQAERDRRNDELTARNRAWRNNWKEYISANVQYTSGNFGGINGTIRVTNRLPKDVANVTVYYTVTLANGNAFKTDMLDFSAISPNSAKELPLNTDRGTRAEVNILSINAPSIHFCYGSDEPTGPVGDPYFCR